MQPDRFRLTFSGYREHLKANPFLIARQAKVLHFLKFPNSALPYPVVAQQAN